MNSKTEKPRMSSLFNGLMQVNQPHEQVPASTKEETRKENPQEEQEKELKDTEHKKSSRKGTVQKSQFLFRVEEPLLYKTRQISVRYELGLSEIMNYALREFINAFEKKHGEIRGKGNKARIEDLM